MLTNCHSKHDRECFYARAVYRTWRSWQSPAFSDPRTPWEGNKCPMTSCSSRFKDISSMLTHLEADCMALRSKVDKACSQAQSTQTPTPVTTVSQVVGGSGESQPRCLKCHSTWCRTKSLFENTKGLKRIRSFHGSLMPGRRKNTPPPDTKVVRGARILNSVEVVHGTQALEPVEAPTWEGQALQPVEVPTWEGQQGRWELAGRAHVPPIELPASSPVLSDSRLGATCGIRSTPSKSFTGVSDMSETTASTHGRDSLVSVYSRPTVSSSSTTLSLPPICTATKPLDTQKPTYVESLTQSPIDTDDGDLSSEVSFISGPQVETPAMVAGQFSPKHTAKQTFAPPRNCSSSVLPTVLSLSSELHQQESYLPSQSIPRQTTWNPDPAPTNPTGFSPEALAPADQASVAKLERLKVTLSNLRKSEQNNVTDRIWAGSMSDLPDEFVLRGALDTFGKLRMGVKEDLIISKFCFAYLTLAMAVEIGESVPETYHTDLRDDFNRFVDTDGDLGLTWRFLNVASLYLNGKQSNARS